MENFHIYLHAKNQLHSKLLSWDTAKILQICQVTVSGCSGYFGRPIPSKKNSINLLMFKSMQKSIHHSLLSCDIAKILHICYFEYFMRAWPHASIMIVSTYMFNIFDAFLLAINQLHSILPSWDNAKDVAKLLFRVRWPYLAMSTKSDSISLYKKFIPDLFLETLLKYCKHVILGDSGMPDLKKKSNLYLISFFIIRYY